MSSEIPYKKYFTLSISKFTHYLPPYFISINQLMPIVQSGQENIRLLLVDDHQLVRKWVRKIIEEQKEMEVVGEAVNGEEAIKLARETSPDVILMDVNMSGIDGIEATRRISADMPKICIIGLSANGKNKVAKDMKDAGASAFIPKMDAYNLLVTTIKKVVCERRIT